MIQLTKDADLLACCIYKEYLERRKNGISKRSANTFHVDFKEKASKIASWSIDDYLFTLGELRRAGLVRSYIDGTVAITDTFIIYMENRFKNNIIEITDFIAKFIP